jgi:UDP-N-acetylglucosamine--N-acetylmuramyl-(pentapeptide) pyrophosphoryl-undecaprenol N-acetylglucosamine transferase
MTRALTVVFAGGGTGGHLFPGIAIADTLRTLHPDAHISFVGARRRIEATVVPRSGYAFDPIWIAGFARRLSFGTLLLPLRLLVSLLQSLSILRRRKPHVVVGTGGYASGPLVYAAARTGRPTLIHEQNERPGATTLRLARIVDEVHVTFDSSRSYLPPAVRVVVSGNPVRPALRRTDAGEARRSFGLDPARRTILVFGGSLGASSLNAATAALLPRLADADAQLVWQTGARDATDCAARAEAFRGRVAVLPFIDAMSDAYSAATLAVCRAGATTIAELAALAVPAVLVPYPFAAADHQRRNARAMEALGAAAVLEDAALDGLGDVAFPLLGDEPRLDAMRTAAAAAGRPNAARDIARAVLRLAGRGEEE